MGSAKLPLFAAVALLVLSCRDPAIPDQAFADYGEARDAYARGDLGATEQILTPLVKRSKGFHQAAFLLSKTYYFQGRLADARAVCEDLVRRHPAYNEAEMWLARIALQEGDAGGAETRLERLLSFDQNNPRLLHLMGTLSLGRGEIDAAIDYFGRAAAFGEELARTYLELARLHWQFGQTDKAAGEIDVALALCPVGSPLEAPLEALRKAVLRGEERRAGP